MVPEGVITLEELGGPIALVTWDDPGKKVNTISSAVMAELARLVERLSSRHELKGLLLRSGKAGQFVAGADLHELEQLPSMSPEQAEAKLLEGHRVFDLVCRLPFPTVVLIDGACMGGGTELALCFDERLVSDSAKTRVGLPEVTIGLIPAWGGSQRMPRCIGLPHAINMICSGEPLSPKRAVELGFAYDAVPQTNLVEEGCRMIERLRAGELWRRRRIERSWPLGLSEDQLQFTVGCAEGSIKARAKGQPTAALAALKAMRLGANLPLEEALAVEREVARELFSSKMSANLIGVFFMNTALARDRGVPGSAAEPRFVGRVGVVGAGLMGAGIATAHARAGLPVTMVDLSEERLRDGLSRARAVVEGRMAIGRAAPGDLAEMLCRLNTSTSTLSLDSCDVIIEAVTENESLKTGVYAGLAPVLAEKAIVASNTSTISITRLAAAVPHPERFAGMHFFYPVDRMQLVEVIRGKKTSDETVVTLVELARRLRKTPIVCNDCPGFLVNRILLPYMNEALLLLLEGATMDQVDDIATRFGFPMGPIALHDLVGLDTALYAGQVMLAAYSDRAVETPLLRKMVEAGRLGKKSGAGFRKFTGKKGLPVADAEAATIVESCRIDARRISAEEIERRLVLSMVVEATRVLEEQIVPAAMHVDMGLILGIGFPAHKGGLLKWCDNEGTGAILDALQPLAPLGKRFHPTELLTRLARTGQSFHSRTRT
jgi:3-hydroxyacyl-CoA dehydrogenase/enoyl-CoA hydratase/3-hydroxybutyryl-CoA epimerase/3-hydroxyacyl-CoA dehydrogenase/enoyl-CoA hydratase/3-hydroxybutyryl-CoA epimerase/enoyl-CoA isomerase